VKSEIVCSRLTEYELSLLDEACEKFGDNRSQTIRQILNLYFITAFDSRKWNDIEYQLRVKVAIAKQLRALNDVTSFALEMWHALMDSKNPPEVEK